MNCYLRLAAEKRKPTDYADRAPSQEGATLKVIAVDGGDYGDRKTRFEAMAFKVVNVSRCSR